MTPNAWMMLPVFFASLIFTGHQFFAKYVPAWAFEQWIDSGGPMSLTMIIIIVGGLVLIPTIGVGMLMAAFALK